MAERSDYLAESDHQAEITCKVYNDKSKNKKITGKFPIVKAYKKKIYIDLTTSGRPLVKPIQRAVVNKNGTFVFEKLDLKSFTKGQELFFRIRIYSDKSKRYVWLDNDHFNLK